jgi:hypothetical protein
MKYPVVVLVLPFLIPASTAVAHGGDASLIHACVHRSSGNVRIVAPDEACRPPESPLHWPREAQAGAGAIRGVQLFEADGLFTVPSGVTSVVVELWGGGGAAAVPPTPLPPAPPVVSPGGGGGGGGYVRTVVAVSPGQNVAVTVGQGGAASCGSAGDAGGDTSFGALALAGGGGGGTLDGVGGAGGGASGGGISYPGEPGTTLTQPGTSGQSAQGTFTPARSVFGAFPPGRGGVSSAGPTPCGVSFLEFARGRPGQAIVQW